MVEQRGGGAPTARHQAGSLTAGAFQVHDIVFEHLLPTTRVIHDSRVTRPATGPRRCSRRQRVLSGGHVTRVKRSNSQHSNSGRHSAAVSVR
jgi:hypothetical protein